MLFRQLVDTSIAVSRTSKRTEKTTLLAQALGTMLPDELLVGAGWLAGELRQAKLNIGYAVLSATWSIPPSSSAGLTLREVNGILDEIAGVAGKGSSAKREQLLGGLLARATAEEQEFLRGLIGGGIRQGALESALLDAIARAFGVDSDVIRRARMFAPSVADVAVAASRKELDRFSMHLFDPVLPMLAHPSDGVEDALERLGRSSWELKLDGARIQVHRSGDDVRIFSRELREVTGSLPEVVDAIRALPGRDLILDGEVVAIRPDGLPHPFQTTMRRFGRKHDDAELRASLPVRASFFDCLLVDGQSLIDRPTGERFAAMASALTPQLLIPRIVTASPDEARAFLDDAFKLGHEGVMAKSLDGPYEAGRRGQNWLKIKRAHTLDLVVIAVEWGSGRRQGTLSNIHLAARDPVNGGFVMLGKTFKGMTDEMLQWQTERFTELKIAEEGHVVHVRPEQVVEVAFNDVQVSPQYPGGVALRLARVKRYRPDKRASQADTIDMVRALLPRA